MNLLQFPDTRQRHLGRAIALQARQHGDQPFILCGDTCITFAAANQRVNALAAGLAGLGLAPGERVAFYMDSGPEVIYLALAASKLGAVWVPINTDYKGAWLEDTVTRSRPHILVTDAAHAGRIGEVREGLKVQHLVVLGEQGALVDAVDFDALYLADAPEPDMAAFSHGDTCAVLWTSGTTGRSKGVLQSHNVWFNAVHAANQVYGIGDDDVINAVLPMYNSAAWVTGIFRALLAGLPLAIDAAFSVSHFWERVDFYRATQSFTLGAMHMFLWNAEPAADDAKHALRKLMAIPMPPHLATPFSERFGLELVSQGLGQSEAMTLCNHVDPDTELPAGSCGSPVANLDTRLVDDDGAEVAVGEAGELWVRPREPFVIFSGYFDDPQATAAAHEGEWYKTGDMLKRDEAGYHYFSDRKKDAVRYKGRNISTFEVELAVRRHPAVKDCAVFGVTSEELASESELKLDVIVKDGQSVQPRELAEFINDNAPYFFVPRYIELVDSLPYTPTNKVQKFKLRERGVTAATWDGQAEGFKAQR